MTLEGCSNLCENENEKCTAFCYHRYRYSTSRLSNRTLRISNCTLLTNVTKTILRKDSNNYDDKLVSAKKCKHYDPFKGSMEEGSIVCILQILDVCLKLHRNLAKIFLNSNHIIVNRSCAPKFNWTSFGTVEAWHPIWNHLIFTEKGIFNNRKMYDDHRGHYIYYFQSDTNPGLWMVI